MEDVKPGKFNYFHVSSDGKWLAFRQEHLIDQKYAYDLFLMTSDSSNRIKLTWDDRNWSGVKGWLADNKSLMIVPHYEHPTHRKDEIIILNLFTNEQQRMFPSWTYEEGSFLISGGWGTVGLDVIYDPTLTRVVYLEDEETMILWDIENSDELWRFREPTLMLREEPSWSPDGSYLAIVDLYSDDIYLDETDEFQIVVVNRDGKEIWRSERYPYYEQWYQSMHFSWSPDEKYLVFRWMVPEDGELRTFLLDTTSWEIQDYCISGSYPVWSPDSNQFIMRETMQTQSSDGEEAYRNVLVDVEKNIIVQLDDIPFRPVAWILNEP